MTGIPGRPGNGSPGMHSLGVTAPKYPNFGDITQNNGYYAVKLIQGQGF